MKCGMDENPKAAYESFRCMYIHISDYSCDILCSKLHCQFNVKNLKI